MKTPGEDFASLDSISDGEPVGGAFAASYGVILLISLELQSPT